MLSQPPVPKNQSPTKPQFLIKFKNNNKRYMRLNQINPSCRYKLPFVSTNSEDYHNSPRNHLRYSSDIDGAKYKTQGLERLLPNEDILYSVRGTSDILSNLQNNNEQKVCKMRIKKQLKIKKLDFIEKNIFKNFQSCNLDNFGREDIKIEKKQKLIQNQFLPPISSSRIINIQPKQISPKSKTTRMVECMDGMITFSPKKKYSNHTNAQYSNNSMNNITSTPNTDEGGIRNSNGSIDDNLLIKLQK